MPLEKGNNRIAIGRNIATEISVGKPRTQAIAIALHTANPKAPKKKKTAMERRAESLKW